MGACGTPDRIVRAPSLRKAVGEARGCTPDGRGDKSACRKVFLRKRRFSITGLPARARILLTTSLLPGPKCATSACKSLACKSVRACIRTIPLNNATVFSHDSLILFSPVGGSCKRFPGPPASGVGLGVRLGLLIRRKPLAQYNDENHNAADGESLGMEFRWCLAHAFRARWVAMLPAVVEWEQGQGPRPRGGEGGLQASKSDNHSKPDSDCSG
jgi:hypothetical protein